MFEELCPSFSRASGGVGGVPGIERTQYQVFANYRLTLCEPFSIGKETVLPSTNRATT